MGSDIATWALLDTDLDTAVNDSAFNSGNITLNAGGKLTTEASVNDSDLSQYEERLRVGIKLTAQENVSGAKEAVDNLGQAEGANKVAGSLRALDAIQGATTSAIGGSVGYVAELERSESNSNTTTRRATTLSASNNLTLISGGDQTHTGTLANAGNNLTIQSGGNLLIQSVQNTTQSDSHSESVQTQIGFGPGSPVSGSASYSDSDNKSTSQQNAQFNAGNLLNMEVEGDTTLQGAVVKGTYLEADLKGDLTITSLQDTSKVRSENASVTIGKSSGGSSFGVSGGKAKGDKAWVAQQSGLIGVESVNIKVKGHTQLNGGIINSEADNLNFETNTLAFADIQDYDDYESTQANIGISTSQSSAASGQTGTPDLANDNQQKVNSAGFQSEYSNKEQITRATIGQGAITVGSDAKTGNDSTLGLNRDVTKAQEITKDSEGGIDLYYSDSSFDGVGSTLELDGYDSVGIGGILNPENILAGVAANTITGLNQIEDMIVDAVTLNDGIINNYDNSESKGFVTTAQAEQAAEDISANIKGVTSGFKFYTNKEGELRSVGLDKTFDERVEAIKGGRNVSDIAASQAGDINSLATKNAVVVDNILETTANNVTETTGGDNVDVNLYTDEAEHIAANADGYSINNANGNNDKLGINTSNTDFTRGSEVIEVLSHELNHLGGGDEATAYLAESEAGYQWRNDNRLLGRESAGGDMGEWNKNNQQVLSQNNQDLLRLDPSLMEFRQYIGIFGGNYNQARGDESPNDPSVPHYYGISVKDFTSATKEGVEREANTAFQRAIKNIPENLTQDEKMILAGKIKKEIVNRANLILAIKNSEGVISIGETIEKIDPETKTKIYSAGQAEKVLNDIINDYKNGEMIIILGHSAGGGDTQDIAQMLKSKNIGNVVTIQIDSVEPFFDDASIPSNVTNAINVFQKNTTGLGRLVRGEDNIVADDERTKISNKLFEHKFSGNAPDSDFSQHQNIDNDPLVQKYISDKINDVIREDEKK